MTTLLILTVGQTDVQIVNDGERCELARHNCKQLHDEIKERFWHIVPAPVGKRKGQIDTLPEGDLKLSTPKLDAVLEWPGSTKPNNVLVLETTRTINSDPHYTGSVLEARLKEEGIENVIRISYLRERENYDDKSELLDAIVRREVVQRLEKAVQETLEKVSPKKVIVANTGGFPVIGHLVEEMVRLHAVVPLDALEVSDGAREDPPTHDRAVSRTSIPEPIISFQARRRAIELTKSGNLLGAWGAVSHLKDEPGQEWTKIIDWLRYFAASLPIPSDCDISQLKDPRMAVRAALRVELALRAGDIPRAIQGTVAFFEAALWDHLKQRVVRHDKKRQYRFHEGPPIELVRESDPQRLADLSKTKQKADKKRPFSFKEQLEEVEWYWIDDGAIRGVEIAKHYLKLEGLTKLGQAVDGSARDLRNDVAHSEPTWDLMNDAGNQMRESDLWSDHDTFLSQPLVQNVLLELNVSQPENLCTDLLGEVHKRIRLLQET